MGLYPCCPSGYPCKDCICIPGSEECAEEFEAIQSILCHQTDETSFTK